MSKVVFINRYFYPDHSATSQLMSDLTFFLSSQDVTVDVVTSRQLYDKPDANLPAKEVRDSVRIFRVWSSCFGRQFLFGRAIDYMTFYLSAFLRLFLEVRRGDTIVAKTDPPLISVVAIIVARLRGAFLVNWLQDLFPEVAMALGVSIPSPIHRMIRKIRNYSLTAARCNVVIGARMGKCLVENEVNPSQISVIHNWSNENDIVPISIDDNKLRRHWGLQEKYVVGYSGNMGRAHEFDTILDAARLLLDDQRVVFLFIGGGAQRAYLEDQANVRGLTNIVFKPYQPREKLALSLSVPDIHLITLRPSLEGLIVPSKFYGIAAAGRPTIFIGDTDGEIPGILRDGGCGYVVEIGSSDKLVEIIRSHLGGNNELREMGKRARQIFEGRYTTRHAMRRWADVLGIDVQM